MLIFLIILILIIILNCLSLETDILYAENSFLLKIRCFGITLVKIFSPKEKKAERKEEKEEKKQKAEKKESKIKTDIDSYSEVIGDILGILKYIPGKIKCRRLKFDLTLSCGDAAETGELCGAIWAVIGMIFPVLAKTFTLKCHPEITINPLFDDEFFKLYFDGIFRLRIYHIFVIVILIFIKLKKYIKFKAVNKNGRTATSD